jgi:transposase-like protein
MDPSLVACPNLACPDKGTVGAGNIRVQARRERRYRCRTCRRTFAATANTPLYRLHHPAATLTLVLTLLLHGCPIVAIVAAFGLDERTVRAWLHQAGAQAALLHERMTVGVEARQVQADEIRVRVRGGVVWAAVALDVGRRLWLATAVARRRDGLLVHLLLRRTRTALASQAFLLAVDGVAGYVRAARSLVRVPERTGRRGRPPLVWPDGFALAQVVKAGLVRGEGIVRRVVVGTEAPVAAALVASHGGTTINTAYIESSASTLHCANVSPRWCAAAARRPRARPSSRAACSCCGWPITGAGCMNRCACAPLARASAGWSARPRWPPVSPTARTPWATCCGCRRPRPRSRHPPRPGAGARPHTAASSRSRHRQPRPAGQQHDHGSV